METERRCSDRIPAGHGRAPGASGQRSRSKWRRLERGGIGRLGYEELVCGGNGAPGRRRRRKHDGQQRRDPQRRGASEAEGHALGRGEPRPRSDTAVLGRAAAATRGHQRQRRWGKAPLNQVRLPPDPPSPPFWPWPTSFRPLAAKGFINPSAACLRGPLQRLQHWRHILEIASDKRPRFFQVPCPLLTKTRKKELPSFCMFYLQDQDIPKYSQVASHFLFLWLVITHAFTPIFIWFSTTSQIILPEILRDLPAYLFFPW